MNLELLLQKIAALEERVSFLEAENARLRAENAELKRRLNQNSSNSSKPPSTDGPSVKRKQKKKSLRKIGAQPGHKAFFRKPATQENIDNHVKVYIGDPCDGCGCEHFISKNFSTCHQLWELPKIKPIVTEYQLESGRCAKCNKRKTAKLSQKKKSHFGTNAQAIISMFTGQYGLSRRKTEKILRECFNLDISLGTISNIEANTTNALEKTQQHIVEKVRSADVAHVDETGHIHCGKRLWTWVMSTADAVLFEVGKRRNRETFNDLVGDFSGTIVSDGYGAYSHLSDGNHQFCWAHFHRTLKQVSELDGPIGKVGQRLFFLSQQVFSLRRYLEKRKISYDEFSVQVSIIEEEVKEILGKNLYQPQLRTLAHKFWLERDKVWKFVDDTRVSMTNNQAERDLRIVVIRRKTSFHTWSERGMRYMERMLSFTATFMKEQKNILDSLCEIIRDYNSANSTS